MPRQSLSWIIKVEMREIAAEEQDLVAVHPDDNLSQIALILQFIDRLGWARMRISLGRFRHINRLLATVWDAGTRPPGGA